MMQGTKGYVDGDYLQAMASAFKAMKQRSYLHMNFQVGQKLLDVGCGPGVDTISLAGLVGAEGEVWGIDHDPDMIEKAARQAQSAGVGARTRYVQADVEAMPFLSGTFDACRSERVFQHLTDPAAAFAEMVRVTRTGGRIVLTEPDWATMSTDSPWVDIERRLMRFQAEQCMNNGYAGRQLYRMFRQQKLANITVEAFPCIGTDYAVWHEQILFRHSEEAAVQAGVLDLDEIQRWRTGLAHADADGSFFWCITMIMVVGTKT